MALPVPVAQLALAASPFAAARLIALVPHRTARIGAAAMVASFALIGVCVFGIAPAAPTSGVWAVPHLLAVPAASLGGLALALTAGMAAWLTTRAVRHPFDPRELVLTCAAMTAVAPTALLGNAALLALPAAVIWFRRKPMQRAANDNHPALATSGPGTAGPPSDSARCA